MGKRDGYVGIGRRYQGVVGATTTLSRADGQPHPPKHLGHSEIFEIDGGDLGGGDD